jgi:N6-adenosine-specific RNA methylase IME4/ParB-like chromosome segregation protein Spo0J
MTVEPELEFHPVADIFPMMSTREFDDLVADIAEHGLREPVWLHRDGRIIDGRNRYLACRKAGLPPEFRGYEGDDDLLVSFVVSLNLHRRHLNESQRAMVAAKIANLGHGQRSDRVDTAIAVSQEAAAEQLNVSVDSLQRAKRVRESGVPELAVKVESGDLAVSTAAEIARAPVEEQQRVVSLDDKDAILAAAKEIKRERIAAARERQPQPVAQPVLAPDGKYSCIVIDPPWPMQKIEREERPNQGSALDYPVMSLEDIANEDLVPVRSLAADDCHIYLWVTHKFLPAGLDLLREWGFNYQCVMTWRKNVGITPFSWMYDTEHVLFGRKGSLKLERLGLRLSFEAPVQGHSAKPDVFYERVVQATPGPRVEMFARRPRDGFTVWGNEVADVV